jgi:hypothetical protein
LSSGDQDPVEREESGAVRAVKAGAVRVGSAIQDLHLKYKSEGRFNQMRIWVVAAVIADALLTSAFVVSSGGSNPLKIDGWFQKGFPSNLVVIRNDSKTELVDVELEIDGRYRAKVDHITLGANGFPIDQQFLDAQHHAPPAEYRPSTLTVHAGKDQVDIRLRDSDEAK